MQLYQVQSQGKHYGWVPGRDESDARQNLSSLSWCRTSDEYPWRHVTLSPVSMKSMKSRIEQLLGKKCRTPVEEQELRVLAIYSRE